MVTFGIADISALWKNLIT